MLSVTFSYWYAESRYAECRYVECRYVECHYAECRYAECRGVIWWPSRENGATTAGRMTMCQKQYNRTLSVHVLLPEMTAELAPES